MIDFSEKGTGTPLLLLHGFCETKGIWEFLASGLAEHYRVITPDLPGCGSSEPIKEAFSIDSVGTRMLEWVKELGLEQPVLVGHSLGGYITLAMARQQPGLFAGIGLFHSTAAPDLPEKKEGRDKAIAFVERHGVEPYTDAFVEGLFHDPHSSWIPKIRKVAAGTPPQTLTGYTSAMRDRKSALDFISAFERPILFVAGQYDTLVTPEGLRKQADTARHPVFKTLEGTAHMGMLENEPGSRNSIENFMKLAAGK